MRRAPCATVMDCVTSPQTNICDSVGICKHANSSRNCTGHSSAESFAPMARYLSPRAPDFLAALKEIPVRMAFY